MAHLSTKACVVSSLVTPVSTAASVMVAAAKELAFESSLELIGFMSRIVYGIAAGRSTAAVVYSLKAEVEPDGS